MLTTDCELHCLPLAPAGASPMTTMTTARSPPLKTPPCSPRGVKRPAHAAELDGDDDARGQGESLVIPSTPPTPKLSSSPPIAQLVKQEEQAQAEEEEPEEHSSLLHLPLHVSRLRAAHSAAEEGAVMPRVVTAAVVGAACAAARTTTAAAATVVGGGGGGGGGEEAVLVSRRGLPAVLLNLTGWNRSERSCVPPDAPAAAAFAASSVAVAHEARVPAAGVGKASEELDRAVGMPTFGLQPTCSLLLCRAAAPSTRLGAEHDEAHADVEAAAVGGGALASAALLRALLADPQMAAVAAAVVVEGDDDGGVRASPWLPPLRDEAVARCPDAAPTLVLDLAQPIVALFPVRTDGQQATSALVVVGVGGRVVALCPQEESASAQASQQQQQQQQATREWRVHDPVSDACVVGGRWLVYTAGGVAYWASLFDSEGEGGVRPLAAALQPTMIGTGEYHIRFLLCFRRTARGRCQLHSLPLLFPNARRVIALKRELWGAGGVHSGGGVCDNGDGSGLSGAADHLGTAAAGARGSRGPGAATGGGGAGRRCGGAGEGAAECVGGCGDVRASCSVACAAAALRGVCVRTSPKSDVNVCMCVCVFHSSMCVFPHSLTPSRTARLSKHHALPSTFSNTKGLCVGSLIPRCEPKTRLVSPDTLFLSLH